MTDSLRLILVDTREDAAALAGLLPDVPIHIFDDVMDADPDEIVALAELRDVVVLVGAEAGPAAHARARDAAARVRGVADETVLVSHPGERFVWPEGLDTPGAALVWLRGLPPLGAAQNGRHLGNGRHVVASGERDDDAPLPASNWPAPPSEAAYHGLVGHAVRIIEEHTEADPLGVLGQALVAFGSAVGRGPHLVVDGVRHGANEFMVLVGETAAARKNTSKARALSMLETIDPEWSERRIRSGLSSGEGLITPVRDPVREGDRVVDEGERDKRLLVIETEFGSVLRALQREGNRLSALLRAAWDGDTLSTMTKSPLRATNPHISMIGHITFHELTKLLSGLEIANGLANRVLWLAIRRARYLPFGGRDIDLSLIRASFRDALDFSRDIGEMTLDRGARDLYTDHYRRLSTPAPGRIGEVTSRAAAHVLRLSMMYALIDRTCVVSADHLGAALALVDASNRAAAHVFGESLGHPDAEKVLTALRAAPGGLTRSEISTAVFKGNAPKGRIAAALGFLVQHGQTREERRDGTGGRSALVYTPITKHERNEINERTPPPSGLLSSNSSNSCFVNAKSDPPDEVDDGVGEWLD